MFMRSIYDEGLAQAAYLIGCPKSGRAVLFDPLRDVDRYIALAAAHGLPATRHFAVLGAMLELGSSQPWPDALELATGTREMDAAPLVEYFAPLSAWLEEQNEGRTCGW